MVVLLVLLLAGCSPSRQIATAATDINEKAASSRERFAVIEAEATAPAPNLPLITEQAVGGQEEQEEILLLTGHIHKTLPGVEDKVPEWVYLLEYIAIGLCLVALAWILWNTGIGTLIKRLIGFIPKSKQRDADFTRMVMDSRDPSTMREYVAARRASDEEFDRAYVRSRTRTDFEVRTNGRSASRLGPVDHHRV